MNEKRQVNGPPARPGRLVGPLVFVILVAAGCLLLLGFPIRAAPDRGLLEQSTLTLTNVLTPTATLGPGTRNELPRSKLRDIHSGIYLILRSKLRGMYPNRFKSPALTRGRAGSRVSRPRT